MTNRSILRRIRTNYTGANEYEVQNLPRCKVWTTIVHNPAAGVPFFVSWNQTAYDTDGMAPASGGAYITCKTAGLYLAIGHIQYTGGAAGDMKLWTRIYDPALTKQVAGVTNLMQPSTFGCWEEPTGFWNASPGDQIGLYGFSDTACSTDHTGVESELNLMVCLISTT